MCYETRLWTGYFSLLLKSSNWMQRTAVQETYFAANTVLYYTVLSKGTQWMSGCVSFHCLKSSETASFLNEGILQEKRNKKTWIWVFKEFLVQLLHSQLSMDPFEIIKPNIYIYDLWKLFMAEIDNFNFDTSGSYRIWKKQLHRIIRQLEINLLQQYKAPVSEPAGICDIRF